MKRLAAGVAALALVAACAGCAGEEHSPPPAAPPVAASIATNSVPDALRTMMLDRVVTAHEQLAAAATDLAGAAGRCDVTAARAAWRQARLAWDRAAVFAIGPQIDAHLAGAVDWWPVDSDAVAGAAAGTEPMTADELEALGAPARGLPAIELLLFGAGPLEGRRCTYAERAAESIASAAGAVAEQFRTWTTTFVGQSNALVDVLSMLADAAYRLADQNLGMPAGLRSAGVPDPSLVRGGAGQMAMEDVEATLTEIGAAYEAGIAPVVRARYPEAGPALAPSLDQAQAAVALVGADLADAVVTRKDQVNEATEGCRNVRRTIATNIGALLGVTLNIPVGDGD